MKKSKKINSKNSTISFETFREIGSYTIGNLKQEKADCFNGLVSIKQYKVTLAALRWLGIWNTNVQPLHKAK